MILSGESAAKLIGCVAGRYVLSGQSSAESGGYHGENRPLPVAAFNEHDHILWIFLERSTRTVGFTKNTTVCRIRQEGFRKFIEVKRE